MTTPDNARLLANERAAFESEQALAQEEQALWLKFEAALADDSSPRVESQASRLSLLAKLADAPAPLLARARELATNRRTVEAVPAAPSAQRRLPRVKRRCRHDSLPCSRWRAA